MRKIAICSFLLLTLPCAAGAFAQNNSQSSEANKTPETAKAPEPPVHFYHLDLLVKEIGEDGKPVNSRAYSCTVSTAARDFESIRAGSKIPIETGASSGNNVPTSTQFQYQDLGVNFDVNSVREMGNKLAMTLRAVVSSQSSSIRLGGANGVEEPVMRQNIWSGSVLLPIGKPTVVFTSDDVDRKGGMEVTATATPLQ